MTKKKITKPYSLLKIAKEISMFLLFIFIIICYYYICICTYNIFNNDSYELIDVYTISIEELKPASQPNIWYKGFLNDFFNNFIFNNTIVNNKFYEIKSDCNIKTLMPIEYNLNIKGKNIILNKIQDDYINNLIWKCEYYKNKTNLLQIQLLKDKISYQELIKDISDIMQDMHNSLKKS